MFKNRSKVIRQFLSKKYLDWAEVLPKFQGGIIQQLQTVREHQRKSAQSDFQRRIKPDEATITLKAIRIVVPFQFEEFQIIQKIVSKFFPNSEKVSKFISDLKNSESSITASGWSNIGHIIKDNSQDGFSSFTETHCIKNIPEYVESIHISYHRIMPSMACLSFTFKLEESFSKQLENKQNSEYFPSVIFNEFSPFRNNMSGYSMSFGNESQNAIQKHIFNLIANFGHWLKKQVPINQQLNISNSIIELYEIKGNPKNSEDLEKWIQENTVWLSDYGISTYSYKNTHLSYCRLKDSDESFNPHILAKFEDGDEENNYLSSFKMDSLSVTVAISSILENIQNLLEHHRKVAFHYIAKFDAKILKKNRDVSTLKKLSAILKRLQHEVTNNGWLNYSISNINDLNRPDMEVNFSDNFINNTNYRIDLLKKSCDIVDDSLTNYLEVQNIYAMYKLQKWIFLLTVVVTLATIVSVVSSWENLIKLWEKVEKFL